MPDPNTDRADIRSPAGAPALTVYWRPGCPYCARLRRQLRRHEVPVQWRNIWDDPSAAATVRAVAGGNETVPTVFVGGDAYVNPPWPRLRALLIAAGHPLSAPPSWPERLRRYLPGRPAKAARPERRRGSDKANRDRQEN